MLLKPGQFFCCAGPSKDGVSVGEAAEAGDGFVVAVGVVEGVLHDGLEGVGRGGEGGAKGFDGELLIADPFGVFERQIVEFPFNRF